MSASTERLALVPVALAEADAFVAAHHRHQSVAPSTSGGVVKSAPSADKPVGEWVWVPREPTTAMIAAGANAERRTEAARSMRTTWAEAWRAMLASAPPAPTSKMGEKP